MKTARILGFGTELVLGRTIDTNSAWLSSQLAELGIRVTGHMLCGDDLADSTAAMRWACAGADVVLCTGGLGPTDDDLTRQALADLLGTSLESRPELVAELQAFFAARNRVLHGSNLSQALAPRGASAIPNRWGTAPGLHATCGRAEIYCMPGVPSEMRAMFQNGIRPRLAALGGGWNVRETVIQTFGGAEAEIGERLRDLMLRGRNPEVGTTAKDAIIGVRVIASGDTADVSARLLADDLMRIRERLGTWVFGEGEATLQGRVMELLAESNQTVATAESCTGGLIAQRLTQIPGSSQYFLSGFVTYSNAAKVRDLGVTDSTLAKFGAVSRAAAEAMAIGCRSKTGTDYAIGVTGIAGPGGGTPEKPVGLVFLALAGPKGTKVQELRWGDHLDRHGIRDRSAKAGLNMLRLELEGQFGR